MIGYYFFKNSCNGNGYIGYVDENKIKFALPDKSDDPKSIVPLEDIELYGYSEFKEALSLITRDDDTTMFFKSMFLGFGWDMLESEKILGIPKQGTSIADVDISPLEKICGITKYDMSSKKLDYTYHNDILCTVKTDKIGFIWCGVGITSYKIAFPYRFRDRNFKIKRR